MDPVTLIAIAVAGFLLFKGTDSHKAAAVPGAPSGVRPPNAGTPIREVTGPNGRTSVSADPYNPGAGQVALQVTTSVLSNSDKIANAIGSIWDRIGADDDEEEEEAS